MTDEEERLVEHDFREVWIFAVRVILYPTAAFPKDSLGQRT